MLAVVGDKHRAVPIWKSPQNLVLRDVLDVCACIRDGNSADVAIWTRRRDFTGRRQRSVASGDGDRGGHCKTGEHERTHRPNETEISHGRGVVARTLRLHRNGAVGFIDWLDQSRLLTDS